jgi:hypothetical protein
VVSFSGSAFATVQATDAITAMAAVGSVTPAAGAYHVGACTRNAQWVDKNGSVTGWVQVTR